jgi:hypothetical protein
LRRVFQSWYCWRDREEPACVNAADAGHAAVKTEAAIATPPDPPTTPVPEHGFLAAVPTASLSRHLARSLVNPTSAESLSVPPRDRLTREGKRRPTPFGVLLCHGTGTGGIEPNQSHNKTHTQNWAQVEMRPSFSYLLDANPLT